MQNVDLYNTLKNHQSLSFLSYLGIQKRDAIKIKRSTKYYIIIILYYDPNIQSIIYI